MNRRNAVRLFSEEKGRFYFVVSLVSAVLFVSAPSSVLSRTWHISPDGTGDAATIQAGIYAASSGDTVLLAAGTYTGMGNRDVSFLGKGVVVRSEGGPPVTIIDCQGLGRGFVFQNDEPRSAVLEGVTITHGTSQEGGAIRCSGAHPLLRRNELAGNTASYGGAIYCTQRASPTIESNIFVGNSATIDGGAIYCFGTTWAVISNNTIDGNTAGNRGGGFYAAPLGQPQVLNNLITNNQAVEGGGIGCQMSFPVVVGNRIEGNNASTGGGAAFRECGGEVRSNIVRGNYGQSGAGVALVVNTIGLTFSSNTIAHNFGTGIWASSGTEALIDKTICAFNQGKGIECELGPPPLDRPTLACTDIYGNTGGDWICGIDGGGNIHADPQFCGAPADSAYFLQASSPCAPANNSCTALMGAFPVGCEALPALATVQCPGDMVVPAFSTMPLVVLHGFTVTNLDAEPRSYVYYLASEGPATLVDNGAPSSLVGVTPVLAPLEEYSPPEAALAVPEITTHCDQTVTYLAIGLWNPSPTDTCVTTVTFDPPVPVFVQSFSGESVSEGVQLTWSVITDDGVSGFRIYRAESGSSEKELITSESVLYPATRTYLDTAVEAGRVYVYELVVVLEDGGEIRSQTLRIETTSYELALHQNTPNPFNPSTTISFVLPEMSKVTLSIYDVEGRLVRTLLDETVGGGPQERIWDGKDAGRNEVGSGVYFCRLTVGNQAITKKMVMVR